MDDPNPSRDAGSEPDGGPGAPRWVKVLAVVGVVVLVLLVLLQVVGGGEHGPGRHVPGDDPAAEETGEGVPGDHAPPEGGHG